MSEASTQPKRSAGRRWPHLLSTILFIAAIGFAAAAVYLYIEGENTPSGPEPPPAEAGRNDLASVLGSLKDAGLNASYGRYSAEANQLDQPGQTIEVNDHNLFVFIYSSAAGQGERAVSDREAAGADLDPATLVLTSRSAERPLNEGEEVHIFQGSNIIAILVGGDGDLVESVGNAISSLP